MPRLFRVVRRRPWLITCTVSAGAVAMLLLRLAFLAALNFGTVAHAQGLTDSDNDGLPDAWELQYLGTLAYGATDDPGNVGRTLLQSYQQGLSPWPTATVNTGLRAWYRADLGVTKDANNQVSQWADLTGYGSHVQATNTAQEPGWVASGLNGKPVIQFSGTNILTTAAPADILAGSSDQTVIAVLAPAATQPNWSTVVDLSSGQSQGFALQQDGSLTNVYKLWWMGNPPAGWKSSPGAPAATGVGVQVLTLVKNGTSSTSYVNGISQGTGAAPATVQTPIAALALGNAVGGGYGYQGQVAEILIYNRAISDTERQGIESGLLTKYVNPDLDGDGLPDAWELKYLGTLSYGPTDDPGNVGRTLLQSYQQGLSPWPTATVYNGLQAWYRADLGVVKDGGNHVSQWTDLSGNGAHVETAVAAQEPGWVASGLNGKPVVQFSGTNILTTAGPVDVLSGSTDQTVFAVVAPAATQTNWSTVVDLSSGQSHGFALQQDGSHTNDYKLWWMGNPPAGWKSSPGAPAASGVGVQVLSLVKNGTSAADYVNGISQGTNSVPGSVQTPVAPLAVGNAVGGGYGYNGQVAEILIYNRALSDTERQSIEAALAARYVNPDLDGDGLPDAWELKYLGTLAYGATDDPGNVGRTLLQSFQQGLSPWPVPSVTSGLRAWYRADLGVTKDASNNVSQWTDLSGNAGHVQTVTPSPQPAWVASGLNGKPVVQFNGTNVLTTVSPVDVASGSSDATVIAVIAPAATQTNWSTIYDLSSGQAQGYTLQQDNTHMNDYKFWWMGNPPAGWKSGPGAPSASGVGMQVLSLVKNGTSATDYLNGVSQGSAAAPASILMPIAPVALGNAVGGGYGYSGQVAELLVYNRALSDAERQSIESALTARYFNPDLDGDGLPDAWELKYFGTLSYGPNDDPGEVGRTLLQSYQQGLSPWPNATVSTGLQAWYRADLGVVKDSGNKVSQWTDLSGNAFHVTQTSSPSQQPGLVAGALNGKPVVQFDGTMVLTTPGPVNVQAGSSDQTVITVVVPSATQTTWSTIVDLSSGQSQGFALQQNAAQANQYKLWVMGNPPTGWRGSAGATATVGAGAQILSLVKNGTASADYVNGVAQGTATMSAIIQTPVAPLALGNAVGGGYGYNGHVAEVLVYNRALSDTERQQVEAALTSKYSSTLSFPTTIGGLELFLKADSGVTVDVNGRLASWQDLSGSGNDVTQSDSSKQPLVVASQANGLPVVRFDGTEYLNVPDVLRGGPAGEIIAVVKLGSKPDQNNTLWQFGVAYGTGHLNEQSFDDFGTGDGSKFSGASLSSAQQYHILDSSAEDGTGIQRFNGLVEHIRGGSTAFTSGPVIGAAGDHTSPLVGDIAEVMVYDHVLTASDRAALGAYLTAKYAPPAISIPAAPAGLVAIPLSDSSVRLAWTTADAALHVVATIERKTGTDDFATIATVEDVTGYTDTELTSGLTYTYRIKLTNYAGTSPYSGTVDVTTSATSSIPIPQSGLRLWLRADLGAPGSGPLAAWTDLSGSSNNATQPDATKQPQVVASQANGQPVVRFNGAAYLGLPDVLQGGPAGLVQPGGPPGGPPSGPAGEIIAVVKTAANPDQNNTLWQFGVATGTGYFNDSSFDDFGTGDNYLFEGASASTVSQYHLHDVSAMEGQWTQRVNGVVTFQRTGEFPAFTSTPVIGAAEDGSSPLVGDIAEVIVYDHVLTEADREAVSTYLTAKYSPPAITIPSRPTLSATAVSSTTVALSWTVPPAGLHTVTTVEREPLGGTFTLVTELSDSTVYIDSDPNLVPGQSYLYRVKVRSFAGESAYSDAQTVVLPSTDTVPASGLRLWLRADTAVVSDPVGNVQTWMDLSGQHKDANQSVSDDQPVLVANAANGRSVVRFDGISSNLDVPDFMSGATAGELFVIVKAPNISNRDDGLWTLGGADGTEAEIQGSDRVLTEDFGRNFRTAVGVPVTPLSNYVIYNVTAEATEWTVRLNGLVQYQTDTNTVQFGPGGSLGTALGKYLQGDIAEVIAFDRVLTSQERETLSNYLAARYAPPAITIPPQPTLNATATNSGSVMLTWTPAAAGLHTVTTIERQLAGGSFSTVAQVSDAATFTDMGLASGSVYTYRIKTRSLVGSSSYSDTVTVTVTSSFPQQGMRLWLKADVGTTTDSNGHLSTWQDQSGQNQNATQSNPTFQPTVVTNALNGLPVVRFAGTGDNLTLPNFMNGATQGEMFIIVKSAVDQLGTGVYSWQLGPAGGGSYPDSNGHVQEGFGSTALIDTGRPAVALNSFHVYNVSAESGLWINRFDGAINYQTATNTVGFNAGPQISRTSFTKFSGDIAEILVYDHVLTDSDRETVGIYLNGKYNLNAGPPAAPTNLTATGISATQMSLVWSDALSTNGVTYSIERRITGGSFAPVAEVTNSLSFIDTGLTANTTYEYRLRSRDYAGSSAYGNIAAGITNSNATNMPLTGIRVWLKADAGLLGSGNVTNWPDQSGLGNNATQPNVSFAPSRVANVVNGLPVVRFAGTGDNLTFPNFMNGLTQGDMFIIVKSAVDQIGTDVYSWQFGGTGGDGGRYPSNTGHVQEDFGAATPIDSGRPAVTLTSFHVYNVSAKAGLWVNRFDGTVNYQTTSNTVAFSANPHISRTSFTKFSGDIAEILVYDHVLTDQERSVVNSYLTFKYLSLVDSNGDGIPDAQAIALGLNPFATDTDGDGIPDAWEIKYGLNPLVPDANSSLSGDGVSNFTKYQLGLDPTKSVDADPAAPVQLRVYTPQRN